MTATADVHGHVCTLTETNRGAFVPLCECGWIGNVTPMQYRIDPVTKRKRKQRDLVRSVATAQHEGHLHDVRAQLATEAERALADHGRRVDLANEVLQRRGRWGNG